MSGCKTKAGKWQKLVHDKHIYNSSQINNEAQTEEYGLWGLF